MISPTDSNISEYPLKLELTKYRRRIWFVSGIFLASSLLGIILSWVSPSIGAPLRPGLDFTGGTQIQLERVCTSSCEMIETSKVIEAIKDLSLTKAVESNPINISSVKVQMLDGGDSIVVRMPFLTAAQGQNIIKSIEPIAGPFKPGTESLLNICSIPSPTASAFILESPCP